MNSENALVGSTVIVAVILPLISAAFLKGRVTGNYLLRLSRCLAVYLISGLLVSIGYMIQGVWASIWDVGRFSSGWNRIPMLIEEYDWAKIVPAVVFVASVTTFVILLRPRQMSLSISAFRALFVVLALMDILQGMMWGYAVYDYIECMVFDFVGSLAFGAIIPIFAGRLVRDAVPS